MPITVAEDKVRTAVIALYESMTEQMIYLYSRWQDEKEYEDIADYGNAMKGNLPKWATFVKVTERPFGFKFKTEDGRLYSFTINARKYTWTRIE